MPASIFSFHSTVLSGEKGLQMQLYSSSPNSQISPLFTPQSTSHPRFFSKATIRPLPSSSLLKSPPLSSKQTTPSLDGKLLLAELDDDDGEEEEGKYQRKASDGLLIVRRPVIEFSGGEEAENLSKESEDGEGESSPSASSPTLSIEVGLTEFAKKMPIFEPERIDTSTLEKPLPINLELALYRAKVFARNFQFDEADKLLRQCISIWPEDGRAYVALGKILIKQSRYGEARSVYEKGSQATQGENPYIWQCWAVLENKMGNIRRARELFDAATVADKRHIAAWHGWAVLELKQGNIKKARNLLGKGLKYCGGNEYIYQTLALLEAKGNRIEQARYLFRQATLCNAKSCASWLAWAQLEMQQENNHTARRLFEKAVQASPKNRFAWHVWALFEAKVGNIGEGRKLLKIGHALNPRDPVLLQSLALLEYRHSSANLARVLFRRASELDPRHQPVWIAWGWVEWKEGNIATARELYQRALSIDSTSESAARCLQAWGVLEQRIGNMTAARRLFRSSLNINSQSYVTWMTWASLEEQQQNAARAEEIRNLYFQQRTEVVDDDSWVMGFLDIIDPALDSIKKLLNLDPNSDVKGSESLTNIKDMMNSTDEELMASSSNLMDGKESEEDAGTRTSNFDVNAFVKDKLSLDILKLDAQIDLFEPRKIKLTRGIWKSESKASVSST